MKGIALVHGVNDGLVPYNQSVEFARAMRQTAVPVDFYSATRKAPGDQADDTQVLPTDAPGHGSEHARHIVIDTGLDLVVRVRPRRPPPPCNRDFTVDGTASPGSRPIRTTGKRVPRAGPSFYGLGRRRRLERRRSCGDRARSEPDPARRPARAGAGSSCADARATAAARAAAGSRRGRAGRRVGPALPRS